jgi:FkbM family methyltransferase
MDGRDALEWIPIFRSIDRRQQAIDASRAIRRCRRRGFEAFGSPRYSHPEVDVLREYLDFDGGYFIEAGANDGFRQSNTYFLERFRGWRGVLVEPIPELYHRCVRERPRSNCFNCALVEPQAANATVVMRFGDLLSHLARPDEPSTDAAPANWGWSRAYDVTVRTKTLSQVLDEAPAPRWDFLSLDLEGHEEQALAGLDLDRHRPSYILVEAEPVQDRLPHFERFFDGRYELVEQPNQRDLLFRRTR